MPEIPDPTEPTETSPKPQLPKLPDLASQETKSYRDPFEALGENRLLQLPEKPEPEPEPESKSENKLEEPEGKTLGSTEADAGAEVEITARPQRDYPAVADSYVAFYQEFSPEGDRGKRFIIGFEGIIGATIDSRATKIGRELLGFDGSVVANVSGREYQRLNSLEQSGWTVECRMAISLYRANQREFFAEALWVAYDSSLGEDSLAIKAFIENVSDRLATGIRPNVELSQEQFERILSSHGRWHHTENIPLHRLPTGVLVHRRKRSFSEWLIQIALKHRAASNIATLILLVAIIVIVYLVFFQKG